MYDYTHCCWSEELNDTQYHFQIVDKDIDFQIFE